MMHVVFWFGSNVGEFLFPALKISTAGQLVGICFLVALIAFFFEFLRFMQAKQRQKELIIRSKQLKTICPSESAQLLTRSANPSNVLNITLLDRALLYTADISLWFVLLNSGYILMLSVMIYNAWIFISAIAGGGIGYFVFGQMFMKLNLQNCQIIRDTFCMQKCGEAAADNSSVPSNADGESTPVLETSSRCHNEVTVHAECH